LITRRALTGARACATPRDSIPPWPRALGRGSGIRCKCDGSRIKEPDVRRMPPRLAVNSFRGRLRRRPTAGGGRVGGRARHLAAPRLFPRVHEARDINYSAVAERRPRAKPGCRPEGRRSREELRPRRPTADQHPRGRGGGGTRATSRLRFLLESNGASMGRRFYFASLASRLLPRSTILSRTRACYGGVIRRFCTSPLTLPAFRAFLGERSTNLDSRE